MFLLILIIVLLIILTGFALIIKDISNGKYNIKADESILAKEAEEKYLKEFPKTTIKELKIQIEKIADLLIDNQESNRYTDMLRTKVKNDYRVKSIKDLIIENVKIMKYNNKILRAKIEYNDYKYKYFLIFDMETVAEGRLFLKDYFIFKDSLNKENMEENIVEI